MRQGSIRTFRAIVAAQFATILLGTLMLTAASAQRANSPAFARAERKLAWLAENGRSPSPSPRPTVLTAEEWNAYLNQGGVKLPEGISNLRISTQPGSTQSGSGQSGAANGDADVNFDRLTGGRTRNNPLLALFTTTHHVTVNAQASAADGVATMHVESVTFDGVTVPRIAIEYFVDRFLRPRYGNAVGLDPTFPIGSRVDTAILGPNLVTITQR